MDIKKSVIRYLEIRRAQNLKQIRRRRYFSYGGLEYVRTYSASAKRINYNKLLRSAIGCARVITTCSASAEILNALLENVEKVDLFD